ncbi:MAG: serine/threonine protein kinase [Deltaproteobacteria bacterium]|nr:serine/threonine protein kinase [Deltaproteobacteria bacterium]
MAAVGELVENRFQLSQLLTTSAGTETWRARHKLVGRDVTLKLLTPKLGPDPGARSRLVGEARAAALVRHPNVVDVWDVAVTADGVPYILMEPVEGESLDRALAHSGALGPRRACELALEVLSALQAAHTAGVVHGQLEPRCVVVGPSSPVKVLGFGWGSNERAEPDVHAAPFVAPERTRGLPCDARSDVFALGALLYTMITGRAPFEGRTVQEIAGAVAAGRRRPMRAAFATIAPGLAAVIDRALATSPAHRLSSARELAEELRPFAPDVQPRPPMPARAQQPTLSGAVAKLDAMVVGAMPEVGPERLIEVASRARERPQPSSASPGTRWLALAAIAAVVAVLCAAWIRHL